MDPELQLKLIMLACLIYLIYQTGPNLILSIQSKNWAKQTATVTTSAFDRQSNIYSPKLIYKYTVKNREYMNDTYTYLGTSTISKLQSIKIAQQHPEGSEINIFVNPDNPEQSVVIPGVHWAQYFSLLLLVLFFVSVAYIVPILNFIWPGCEPNCT